MPKGGRQPGILIPNLRAWRRSKFMSQEELAESARHSTATISHIENGGRASLRMARRLAIALGVTPEALVTTKPTFEPTTGE